MKNEPNFEPSKKSRSLDEAFAQKPHVRERLLEISDMLDAAVAEGLSAHQAEERAIEPIRRLGQAVLTEWGEKSEEQACDQARKEDPTLQPYRKKNG